MRRIVIAVMGTLSGLVLLFSYHTSTNSDSTVLAGNTTTSDGGASGGSTASAAPSSSAAAPPSSAAASSSAASSSTSSSAASSGTYTGDAVDTRWGTVQVRITVSDGKITKAEAVQYPNENPRDQEINAFAVPQLNSEVVSQQSGSIDAVSGATVTSGGYIQSLQSAIDQAKL